MLELEEIIEGSKAATLRKRSLREYLCSRRWFQFSLRTFMIFVTLLCIGIVVTLNWVIPAERQRRAAQLIEEIGGCYALEGEQLTFTLNPNTKSTFYKASNTKTSSHSWYDHYFKRIEHAYLPNYVSGVHSLEWDTLPKLRKLVVDDANRLYPADRFLCEAATKLQQLKSLEVVNLVPSSEGIRVLTQLENLESVAIDVSTVKKKEAAELARMKNLRSLTITRCLGNEPNVLRDLTSVKSVRVLVPTYGQMEIQGIQFMPGLENADLVHTAVTEADIHTLVTCDSLKTIRVKKSLQESLSQKTLDDFKKLNITVIGGP